MNLDRGVAAAAIAGYAAAVVALLPPAKFAHMLGGGAVVLATVAAAAHVLNTRSTHGFSLMAVSLFGIAVLAMPNFPAMGGEHLIGVALGFLGSQAAVLLWVALRWTADTKPRSRTPLTMALLAGLVGAVALSAMASIPIGIGLLSGEAEVKKLLWVFPGYFGGALSTAVLYWMLQGVAHRPVGRYLIGALGGFCLYAAVGPVASLVRDEPIALLEIAMIGTVCGFLVGPPVAITLADEEMAPDPARLKTSAAIED